MKDFTYTVLRNQRLGIVGPNGCGKSTLLKIMAGLEQPDEGHVEVGETIKIGYLAQEELPIKDSNQRVIDYVKEIGEYVQTRDGRISASQMLERFLFTPDMQYTPISKLSGGEKRRLYLLSVLVSGANVLILDEPSNDVDIPTVTILEDYLNAFSGIVITVSHDRYFLDNVVDASLNLTETEHCVSTRAVIRTIGKRKSEDLERRERYPVCRVEKKRRKKDLPERTGSRTDRPN